MKNLIPTALLFSCLIISGQENSTKVNLVGYWTFEQRISDLEYDVVVYKRCNFNQTGQVVRFTKDGKYSIEYKYNNLIKRPRRCGNEIMRPPKDIKGIYSINLEKKKINLNSLDPGSRTSWNFVWIDTSSFGIKVFKS